ncbi:glycine zipper family protein [Candidatus Nitrosacidococcus tergens]|uniref:Glycine-zipper-containing OmpA-like membrane domain-containing protein n=1 Tax=Candidatus Nitrosacidococcus tergens TaxID=553981 RepID=A0A7G1QBM9_9GAMM|nr:glycine zipper family protein [Candidatus Nitrosacidococcus tergens]CAB1277317.1 conserved protein of unknown function [Candidatus Nitrosacidococcus tergens]
MIISFSKTIYIFLLLSSILIITSCARPRPVLYPNDHFNEVGAKQSLQDIQKCREMAETAGANSSTKSNAVRTVENSVANAGMGAVSGVVGGAIIGDALKGATVGAASGAAYGLMREFINGTGRQVTNSTYINFVNRCLKEAGYDVEGWE